MKQIVSGLLFACAGCLAAPTSGEPTSEEEAIVEAPEEVRSRLPTWNTYLLGPDLHDHRGKMVYYDYPQDSDQLARVIAVRAGDEHKPERWIHLRLEMYRLLGDAYFEKMIADRKLTLLDLVVIAGALESYKAMGTEPPLISTIRSPAAKGKVGRQSEQPYGPPLPPGWGEPGDDHRGPAGGPSGPRGPAAPHPYPNGNLPGAGGPPGTPKGVSPTPPVPGTEADHCDGQPCFWPDSRTGIEWKAVPLAEKWSDKLSMFFDGKREAIRVSLRHALLNDGKNPGCTDTCHELAQVAIGSMWTGIMLICVAATEGVGTGPCMSGVTGVVAGGASGLSSAAYGSWVGTRCPYICAPE